MDLVGKNVQRPNKRQVAPVHVFQRHCLRRQVRWLSSIPLVRLPLSNQGTQAYQIVWNNVHLHQVRTLGLASVVTLVHRFLFEKKRPRTLLEQT